MVHLVSYDLLEHEGSAAYAAVEAVITEHAISFRQPLYSQWLVETDDSAKLWRQRLKTVLDPDDSLLVVRVTPEYAGWLEGEIWEWLRERV